MTGNSLSNELQTRVFAPAGMTTCYLETPDVFATEIVRGYQLAEGDDYEDVTEYNDGVGLGDGGVVCSAADLARFLPALMGGAFFSQGTLNEMLDTIDDGEGGQYGLGIGYDANDEFGILVDHDGASSGFQSNMVYLPDEDLVVVVLTNNLDSEIVEDLTVEALNVALEE